MIKYGSLLATLLLFCACQQQKAQSANQAKQPDLASKLKNISKPIVPQAVELIVPGVRIGKIAINANADSVMDLLGKPDMQDAAMGSSLMTWYANHDTSGNKTSIFSEHHFGSKDEAVSHIRKILITSPLFKTADEIHTGLPVSVIEKKYALKPATNYVAKGKKIIVYEAAGKGIAFEADSLTGKCVAIVIHKPGDDKATYINMH